MSSRVAYDKTDPLSKIVAPSSDSKVSEAIKTLWNGYIPSNLAYNTVNISNFRDALLHSILDSASYPLQAFTAAIQSQPEDSSGEMLRIFSEYGAALAYATGDVELATDIILRNPPTVNSGLLKTIAEAISKKMSPETFKELLTTSTAMSHQLMINA
jgi:hypothetical protein